MHSNSFPWTALNFTAYQIADLQCTAMYWNALLPLLCTALHCTALSKVFKYLDIIGIDNNTFNMAALLLLHCAKV